MRCCSRWRSGSASALINGALTAYGRLQSFIVTLAALTAVRGIALLVTDGYSTPIDSTFLLPLGQGKLLGLYTPTWIAIVTVAGGWYVFNHTRFGRYIVAVGSNAESLRRSGVDIRKIQLAALHTDRFLRGRRRCGHRRPGWPAARPTPGTLFELEVITAVVLGGTSLMGGRGSIIGSAIGALTLGIISNGLVLLRVDVYWVPIVQAIILIVAIFLNSTLFCRIVGIPPMTEVDVGCRRADLDTIPPTTSGSPSPTSTSSTTSPRGRTAPSRVGWDPDDFAGPPVTADILWDLRHDPFGNLDNCRLDDLDVAVDEVARYAALGGRTILEATGLEAGRDLPALRRISEAPVSTSSPGPVTTWMPRSLTHVRGAAPPTRSTSGSWPTPRR